MKQASLKSSRSLLEKRWVHLPQVEASERMAREASLSHLLGHVLWHRGCQSVSQIEEFLSPRLQSLGDPFSLTDLERASRVILQAWESNKKIVIYGDYDVDGMTSTAFLYRFLKQMEASVHCFLPDRITEGYGLTAAGARRCLQEYQPDLLIAVDCATTAVAECEWLKSQGVQVVIIDHHELAEQRPQVEAMVNPHQDSRWTYFASVGLVFKVCHGILKLSEACRNKIDLKSYLDLVAVGTVADLVPLIDENRILVQRGLEQLRKSNHLGLRLLQKTAGIRSDVRASDVGFRIAPRLNAGGRMGDARRSLEVLISDDAEIVGRLVEELDSENRERQKIEQLILQEALQEVEKNFTPEKDRVIVLGKKGWHCGVIGIVASRIQKTYHRPTVIIGFDDAGTGKGSGRSVEGCSLVDLLRSCDDHLLACGGHEMAAGLTVHESSFADFRNAMIEQALTLVNPQHLQPQLTLHGKIKGNQVSESLYDEIHKIAPFGQKNSEPVFEIDSLQMTKSPKVFGNNHIKFFFKGEDHEIEAVGFGMGDRPWDSRGMRLAGIIDWDDYRDQVQVRIVDWKTDSRSSTPC